MASAGEAVSVCETVISVASRSGIRCRSLGHRRRFLTTPTESAYCGTAAIVAPLEWRAEIPRTRRATAMETRVAPSEQTPPNSPFEALPWRIFIDSCTVQTMRRYGEFIYDGGSILGSNKIHQVPNGLENVVALRDICQVTSRALFQWIVSDASRQEARAKGDPDHLQWLYEVAHYARAFLDETGPTPDSEAIAARLDEHRFGYLGQGDRILLQDACSAIPSSPWSGRCQRMPPI
jgi:hypothetical protein